MATENTVNIGINVSSNGTTEKEIKRTKELKGVLDQAVAAAAKMGKGGAATLGSITQATGGPSAATTYGVQRGVAGTTGAGARDFAKESEGLGGLVRVYATFAANIYAVSTAFNALSTAMDTANMVKGLDQLGAASGRSLGSLSKSLAAVTGGAITVREAMGSVASSSAAGLTSEQILKMGTVATKASQALGINLADAFSRISRGVTKLEPELLDELGLFTKLGPATEAYARSVGKSVGQLTDFERRQAYANAVLKEGIDKFGKINIDVNPFVQLSASLQNLMQSGLEIVGKVLGPIVSLLASSPTALTLVIAGLGSMLLKQTIPAIGQFREKLKEAAENALVNVATKSTPYRQGLVLNQAAITAQAEAEAEKWVSARDAATDKFNALSKSKLGQMPTVSKVLEKGIYQVSEADLKMLDDRAARSLTTNKALSASYTELAATIRAGIAAEAGFQAEKAKGILLNIEAAETSKKQMLADVEFRQLGIKAVQREMAAKAAATAKELGFVASLKESWMQYLLIRKQGAMINVPIPGQFTEGPGGEKIPKRQDVKVDPIGRTAGLMGLVGAGASAAATGIGAVVSKLGAWGMAAFAAYEIGSLVVSMFTKTEKESAATAAALDKLVDANKTVDSTLKDIASRDPFERLTIDSINARTTAFAELTLSISDMVKTTNQEMDKMQGFDKFINWMKGLVGKDVQSKSAEEFAKSLQASFKVAVASDKTTESKAKIEAILGVSINDIEGIERAYKKLGGSAGENIKTIITNLNALSKEQKVASARAVELRDSWKESFKALTDFMTSALPKDTLSKIGQDMMADANKLAMSLKDPTEALVVMTELAGNTNALKLFPPAAALQLASYSAELKTLTDIAFSAEKNLSDLDEQIEALTKGKRDIEVRMKIAEASETRIEQLVRPIQDEIARLMEKRKFSVDIVGELKTKTEQIKGIFGEALKDQFIAGANILSSKIATEWAKAGTTVSNGVASLLGDSLAANAIRADNQKIQLKAQLSSINTQINLIIATEKLTAQIELQRIEDKQAQFAKTYDSRLATPSAEVQTEMTNLDKRKIELEKKIPKLDKSVREQIGPGSDALIKQFKAGAGSVTREDINFVQMLESSLAGAAQTASELKLVDLTKVISDLKTRSNMDLAAVDRLKEGNQLELDKFKILEASGKVLDDSRIREQSAFEIEKSSLEEQKQLLAIKTQVEVKDALLLTMSSKSREDLEKRTAVIQEINRLEEQGPLVTAAAVSKRQAIWAASGKKLADTDKARLQYAVETQKIVSETRYASRSSELEVTGILLETQKAMDLLTVDEYTKRKALLDVANLELSADKSRNATQEKYVDIIKGLEDYKKTLFAGTPEFDLANKRIKVVETQRDLELSAISTVAAARRADIEERSKYTDRQNAYADVFKKSFEGMADAIVEFARTGKLNFKDLVNNMIADLVRWELREQASSLYKMVRPGLTNLVGNLFGTPTVDSFLSTGYGSVNPLAQGGAFDGGIKKFAMGGTFANSIVSSPTLFKFASGTGLMGEAGPEAIMPLKRDAQGNLGVRSGNNGGNVEVVVNNYGSEKATTTQSTDSRGNRKVEVIIGDLSAGEISRNGSNSQRSLRGTYGLQPALIRR
jgi:hypothetical protein